MFWTETGRKQSTAGRWECNGERSGVKLTYLADVLWYSNAAQPVATPPSDERSIGKNMRVLFLSQQVTQIPLQKCLWWWALIEEIAFIEVLSTTPIDLWQPYNPRLWMAWMGISEWRESGSTYLKGHVLFHEEGVDFLFVIGLELKCRQETGRFTTTSKWEYHAYHDYTDAHPQQSIVWYVRRKSRARDFLRRMDQSCLNS